MTQTQTIDTLINDLRENDEARVVLVDGVSPQDARTILIGAARAAGIRVSVHRDQDEGVMIATALTPAQALTQARKAALLRASRSISEAVKILEKELVVSDPSDENGYDPAGDILDLKEILADLQNAAGQ